MCLFIKCVLVLGPLFIVSILMGIYLHDYYCPHTSRSNSALPAEFTYEPRKA
ncbi:unnamed protein product [Plutella xylostella]|uniref:(diamondback moth) hypothetical protein n=1 Tax=Plutella xylostella TaxID=51655 RepID=A0A8S4GBL7_PLUXY|nr:unnamed protein product [Plutella xylostella]